jgi:amidase
MKERRDVLKTTPQGDDIALSDPVNAFCIHGPRMVHGTGAGPLADLHFAAKDLLDVEGYVTGCGNPDWLRSHGPAAKTAPVIQLLLDAGATMVAKTHTDELAYSLKGENAHYGTPINSRAPGRIPGGSSSGSAAAVAARLVDFSIGTDTGGSVRVPASYCGVYGVRPTHGRVPMAGCMPLAPSLDTIGWFADTAKVLVAVGEVLLKTHAIAGRLGELLVASDLIDQSSSEVAEACGTAIKNVQTMFASSRSVQVSTELADWANALRALLGAEAWKSHGAWITAFKPEFGARVRESFAWASMVSEQQTINAGAVRRLAIEQVTQLLGDSRILVIPTTPYTALPIDTVRQELEPKRAHTLTFTCIAGLCGLPQINLPLRGSNSAPVGLSFIGPKNSDETLLALAASLEDAPRAPPR